MHRHLANVPVGGLAFQVHSGSVNLRHRRFLQSSLEAVGHRVN